MRQVAHRPRAFLVALGLALAAVSSCAAPEETDPTSSPQGELDDEGATERDPNATVEEPGGERDARPAGEDPEMGGELGEVEGDDDDGG